ncbi:lysophospholipid acyltransferase family protein [Litoreibacter janthinus]|uniref:Putative hemolysin n=1 Tax=Litoreibacter janthinus TaxID=670154 RepID=A0A1I6H3L4_9RHOB|nr:lysophospholipid acyltransferase family protein [Litoreibacter janthinus]SFR49024.1 Putative hemolysin [Litoreibacter janthinus]
MNQAPREISYAHAARSRGGRALIRVLENTTGRIRMIRRARGYEQEVAAGADFWEVMTERYGLTLEVMGGAPANIPSTGPLITIANHPYGILDGLMMGHILSHTRGDFRILANAVFRKAEDINKIILPISFDQSKEAVAQNVATRKEALSYLGDGGAVGVFPGGTVSTSAKPFGEPIDPAWRTFTAKLIAKSEAAVVPIYFAGSNSRLFQLASHAHPTLRLALLIKEFKRRVDEPVRVVIGDPIPKEALEPYYKDPKAMMDFLRRSTYELAPEPLSSLDYGYEFEDRWKQKANGAG